MRLICFVRSTSRLGLLAALLFPSFSSLSAPTNLVALANPLQGTDSHWGFSHGNTYPAIALPFPMNTWAPYTQPQKDSFYYQYRKDEFRGVRQTHQPSAWIPEYAAFALMPVSGKLALRENERVSKFRHDQEIAQPSYYRARLDTWQTSVEVTPTERAARLRFTFERAEDAIVVLDLFPSDQDSELTILPAERKIIGIARNHRGAVPNNFGNYFVIEFDQAFQAQGVWTDDETKSDKLELQGKHIGAYVKFNGASNQVIGCRVASSFISAEQAHRTLEHEIGRADFNTIRQRAETRWNEMLGRVRIEGGSLEQQRTFYSALYRSVLFPHRFYEIDVHGQPIYYSPYDGKVRPGYMYTDTGYWDTFRAAHPLYNLLFPDFSAEILQGVVNAYRDSGFLPQWSSPGHRNAMIGNHAFSVIADAWVKGVTNFNAQLAMDAMLHDAHNEGWGGIGRGGAKLYDKLDYIPTPETSDSTAKTLEYAYDDFCAAVLAQALGRTNDYAAFARTAWNFTNVFNPATGFMQGRKTDGSWAEPFDPIEWGGPFVEGNAWQWTWSVMHEVPTLVQLLGGDAAFARKLDTLFTMPPDVKVGTYRGMIHEMNEMVAQGMGQYAHCNEPNHHIAYLYNYAGQPWKTQFRVRRIMNQLYHATPDGLAGDEDNGQMSAWYVFSALGFYPVCPGSENYLIGSPLFDRATLQLAGGKQFVVSAADNGPQRLYIRGAKLNGQDFNRVYLRHSELLRGGEIRFQMDSMPNQQWAIDAKDRPSR